MGSPFVTGSGTSAHSPRSDTSHCADKRDGGMWPQCGVGRPFQPLLTLLYHLRRSLLPDCTGRADFASAGELTWQFGPLYTRNSARRRLGADGASSKLLTDIR